MRVLMFGWEFPPHNNGGLGVACSGLAKALADDEVDITFVLPRQLDITSDTARFVFASKGSLECYALDSSLAPYMTDNVYSRECKDLLGDGTYGGTLMEEVYRYARKARGIAQEESFDVIHAHDWLSILAGIEAKKASGKPLIYHVHATEYDRSAGQGSNPEIYEVERTGVYAADKVVAVSHYVKERIITDYGINSDKIEVVHNGIDCQEYGHKELPPILEDLKRQGNKIVMSLGRLTVMKGVDYLVKAAEQVLRFNPNVYFVIVGSGDMERQIIDDVARRGMSDKFIFTGFLRGDDASQVYQSADLFVMPSVSEPFGLVPLESLLEKTPVLISKQSGVSEVLHHALKVDFWDTDEMANQIIAALEHSALHRELVKNGMRQTLTISWDKAAEKMKGIYKKVLDFYE